ncbi:threonine synthase [Candidatus Micrarchaeota archaeon]|nr:threonine synthase [Candidatus Micrarchaeota archaeon]
MKTQTLSDEYWLACSSCKKTVVETQSYTTCPWCQQSLEVKYDYERIAEHFNVHVMKTAPMAATKYLDLYPLANLRRVVSLNEGGTPLYRARKLEKQLGLKRLWIKFEGSNPTGGFKDRGSLVELTKALELGAKTVTCASTGNMAASVSAYAAVAGLPCYIIVPEGTPLGKMAQTLAFGSRVVQVRGTYDDAVELTTGLSRMDGFFLAGDYAFRLEGQKSQSFEVVEQLGWRSPDLVMVPVGNGTNASAIWKGFKEFEWFGLTDSLPKMVAVQPENVAPIVKAFNQNEPLEPVVKPQTVAGAVCVGNPSDAHKLLAALRESGGSAATASDHEILEAQKWLAKTEAVFVEPAAALNLATLKNMLDAGQVDGSEEVVLVMTGTGLKDPTSALKVLPSPPSVEPDLAEVQKLLDYNYYKICADYNGSQSKGALITQALFEDQLLALIQSEFDVSPSKADVAFCVGEVNGFLEKGKHLTKNDLKLIVEEALQRGRLEYRALDILDFTVKTAKTQKPEATAKVRVHGKEVEKTAQGVGPVDAVINAVKKTVEGELAFELVDYKVAINTKNTDATVDVRITLEDEKRNKVTTMGTSPDIIVASIKAFQDGYNILYAKNQGFSK